MVGLAPQGVASTCKASRRPVSECPSSGSFRVFFLNDEPSAFSLVCQQKLLTLRYDANAANPMPQRFKSRSIHRKDGMRKLLGALMGIAAAAVLFVPATAKASLERPSTSTRTPVVMFPAYFSDQRGVDVRIENYGKTESAPFYEPMYEALEADGYVRDKDIRVAGYDSRLTPDMRNFVNRAKRLIEDTYRDNGNRPVHVVGHSNRPLSRGKRVRYRDPRRHRSGRSLGRPGRG